MRPRTKKHFNERYERVSPLLISEPEKLSGKWRDYFKSKGNENQEACLGLEIGCGKGAFISGMSEANPDGYFVALEIVPTVILMAMERVFKEDGSGKGGNVRFICADARRVNEYFAENELDNIYLNFSDPWPRPKHAKNRLTHPAFLGQYKQILKPGGMIRQKTDDLNLFEYSCAHLSECGFEVEILDYIPADNIMTEYEARFTEQQKPIYRLQAVNIK